MNQSLLTNFFKTGKAPVEIKQPMKKRSLNIGSSATPSKVKHEIEDDGSLIIISSDEENVEDINLSGTSIESASSESTIVYIPQTPQRCLQNSFIYESPGVSTSVPISPAKRVRNPEISTPASTSKVRPKTSTSSSKKARFFSPNKQRSVLLKSPSKGQRTLTEFVARKQLFTSDEDERYVAACEGVDDKSKYLLYL